MILLIMIDVHILILNQTQISILLMIKKNLMKKNKFLVL